jgi:hypothetical protein
VEPDIFPGDFDVTGNMTVLFADAVMRDYFLNETEVAVIAAFTAANTANADFQVHNFPRVKFGAASKNDGETGLSLTMSFVALENTAGGAALATIPTTYWMQDSAAT